MILWKISLDVPTAAADAFEAALQEQAQAVTRHVDGDDDTRCRIEALCDDLPDRAKLEVALALAAAVSGVAVPSFTVERMVPQDWLALNREQFAPFRIGRFLIRQTDDAGPVPPSAVDLRIDAALAFGSGRHGSTAGCLLALDRLAARIAPRRPLDVGCGSGILAIAAAKLWHVPVRATDIDPHAITVARENSVLNGVGPWVRTGTAAGYRSPVIRASAPYDLITANILARPLMRMAGALSANLAPAGTAVLSGLLIRSAPGVLAAHTAHGLRFAFAIDVEGWRTLVLKQPG